MSRLTDEDWSRLLDFAGTYSLKVQLGDNGYLSAFRGVHKRHLALLSTWAQMDADFTTRSLKFGSAVAASAEVREQFRRATSDASEAVFCALHGAYKAAHGMLRSAVENYVRAFGALTNSAVIELKSVYELFDIAREEAFFSSRTGKECFLVVRDCYSKLCGYVHSGADAHKLPVHALEYFPMHDAAALGEWVKLYERAIGAILISILEAETALFHSMHYRVQDVLSDVLPRASLRTIHGDNQVA